MPTALELCEDFTVHLPPRLDIGLIRANGFAYVPRGPGGALVQQIRLDEQTVAAAVDEARALARERGTARVMWSVGALSTPGDLADRLGSLGLVPHEDEPMLTSMAITHEPHANGHADARRVDDVDDFERAQEIDLITAGVPAEDRERLMAGQADYWAELQREGLLGMYLARFDGRPVGFGRARFADDAVMLLGGGVLEDARGNGVYRSLVHARWVDAAAHGAPLLLTQAGRMSQPILERLGFETLGVTRVLVDRL